MNQYEQKADLYFELKGSPESTKNLTAAECGLI